MKNTVVAICVCLCPGAIWAQSTCETRVDAHQQATTRERITYCLSPDAEVSASHNPGLVFSGVSSPRPDVSYPPEKATSKGGDFKADRIGVSKEFVETNHFPKLSDGRVSQQEILQKQAIVQEGKQMAQAAVEQSKCALSEEDTVQTPAGVQARGNKPGRQVKSNNGKAPKSASAKKNTKPKKTTGPTSHLETKTLSQPADEPQASSYAPADESAEVVSAEEIPVGTVSYAPVN